MTTLFEIEIKEIKLSDDSITYDLMITPENSHRQIAIACESYRHAIELKEMLKKAVSIDLMY